MPEITPLPPDYAAWLGELKTRIHSAQLRAALAVNRELVLLYWQIGQDILQRQSREGWGRKVIDRLAHDLREAFPSMKGFSARNLHYMRAFAEAWPQSEFVQQTAAQMPWFHICTLLNKLKTAEEREWYAVQAVQQGWSRSTLEVQIRGQLMRRQGRAVTNFEQRLPLPHSELAQDTLIGLLLCKTQNRLVAEYALSGIEKPIGVAEYELVRNLPERLTSTLPTIEALEQELRDWPDDSPASGAVD